ncbi:MAG: hypothetical protein ACT4O9_07395 [Blastocatellia bacterium]
MPKLRQQLVGNWEKITDSECSRKYPDNIMFQENKLYFTQSDPGKFTYWDVGTYEITPAKNVKLSTANDAVIAYKFTISKNILTFVDPDGCEFKYRRAES